MSLEIAKLLKKVLDIIYCFHNEVRILYRPKPEEIGHGKEDVFELELKGKKETYYFEDEESVLYHLGEVLDSELSSKG